jgi:two-component system cell cycle sensor histidine kinase/response regulator CckA
MTDPGLPAVSSVSLDQRYRELFEGALLGIYVTRPNGELLACNAAFARMLGFASVADAVGSSMSGLFDATSERDLFVASVREHGRLEHHRARLRRRDGGVVAVIETVVGEFDGHGALTGLRGFLIDVTASVEAELARLERERQFRAVFVDAADAMLMLDDGRIILEANPSACALFGVPADAIRGESLDGLLVSGEDELRAAWRELKALGEARCEHRVRSRGAGPDKTRLVECSYRARVHGQRHLCIARDITDRRLIDERLMQSEKIESVGRLAGGIAHEFNNLLTVMLGYTELLLGNRGENDPDRTDLEEIQKAGQRAAALTQQLLAFSRKQVLMPKDVDLNQTVAGLQTILARLIRADVTLSCELAPSPAIVRIDPTQIEQAILNLVLNARDALPAGGQIRLEVSLVPRSQVDMPPELASNVGDFVRLRVVDNGVGISPETRAHLFEPFFTTKEVGKGTGLGLASVYGIVHQSNGVISVESEPGAGSVFTMHFPVAPHADERSQLPAAGAQPGRARETVLIVEDEDAVRVIISAVLRRQGYNVVEASGARVACEIVAQRSDIDLLLTDVVVPDMDGPALAQRLIGLRPELRVLFISGDANMLTPPGGDNPNVGFLSKPFLASALTSRVAQMLAPSGPSGGGAVSGTRTPEPHSAHSADAKVCENGGV